MNFKHGVRMQYNARITDMCGDLQAESSEWLFKSLFAGAGEYCGGPEFITLCASCGAVYCNRSCLCIGLFVGLFVCLLVGLLLR